MSETPSELQEKYTWYSPWPWTWRAGEATRKRATWERRLSGARASIMVFKLVMERAGGILACEKTRVESDNPPAANYES